MGSKVSVHKFIGTGCCCGPVKRRNILAGSMWDERQMERTEGAQVPRNTLSDKHHLILVAPSAEDQIFNITFLELFKIQTIK